MSLAAEYADFIINSAFGVYCTEAGQDHPSHLSLPWFSMRHQPLLVTLEMDTWNNIPCRLCGSGILKISHSIFPITPPSPRPVFFRLCRWPLTWRCYWSLIQTCLQNTSLELGGSRIRQFRGSSYIAYILNVDITRPHRIIAYPRGYSPSQSRRRRRSSRLFFLLVTAEKTQIWAVAIFGISFEKKR